MFVALVGPDGVGKTSVADYVVEACRGRALYFHFCPTPDQPLRPFVHLGDEGLPPDSPEQGNTLVGVLRLARNLLRFWWAYLVHIGPARRRGSLVIGDRWAYGYQASPRGVRFYGPAWLGRLATRVLPKPDLILNLTTDVDVIHARKDELTFDKIERELIGWRSLDPVRRVDVDVTDDLKSITDNVLEILKGAGWSR